MFGTCTWKLLWMITSVITRSLQWPTHTATSKHKQLDKPNQCQRRQQVPFFEVVSLVSVNQHHCELSKIYSLSHSCFNMIYWWQPTQTTDKCSYKANATTVCSTVTENKALPALFRLDYPSDEPTMTWLLPFLLIKWGPIVKLFVLHPDPGDTLMITSL